MPKDSNQDGHDQTLGISAQEPQHQIGNDTEHGVGEKGVKSAKIAQTEKAS